MHPDLAALKAQYDELSKAANQNHISVDDATATLAALSVTDGTGAVWQVDAYGNFTRAEYPGATPEVTDHGRFVDPFAAPHASDFVGHDPFAHPAAPTGGALTPPGGFGQSEAAAPASPFAGATHQPPTEGFHGTDHDPFAGSQYTDPAQRDVFRPADERRARSLTDAGQRTAGQQRVAAVSGLLRRNLIVVVALLVIAGIVGSGLLGDDGGEKIPTQQPDGTSQTDDPATGDDPTVGDPGQDTLPIDPGGEDPEELSALPTADDVARVRNALTSGDRDAVAANVATADPQLVAVSTALFSGLRSADLKLDTGEVAETDDGVVGAWTISGTGVEEIVIAVSWVPDGNTWKLATPPVP